MTVMEHTERSALDAMIGSEKSKLNVLIVEDNPGDADLIRETLDEIEHFDCTVVHVERVKRALEVVSGQKFDIILLDMSLPDSQGFDTLNTMRTQVLDVPIIILTGLNDERLAIETVQAGAQDYVLKNNLNAGMLQRIMRYAIERQQLLTNIRNLSLADELTGLYNRRGFTTLGTQQLRVADRLNNRVFLFFVDLDKMKWINDNLGHATGDDAIIETADILRETFRKSDIIARLGGDEFVVLAVETTGSQCADSVQERLRASLLIHNQKPGRKFELSFSIGVTEYRPQSESSLEELITKADSLMYEQKQARKMNRR